MQRICAVGADHWSTAGDVSRGSAIDQPITGWSTRAGHHQIVLNRHGESHSSRCFDWWSYCIVSSLWRIAALLPQAVLGEMPSPLAMTALPQILLFLIICIISLIPLRTFAAFTGFTPITTIPSFVTLLCKEQSFYSELILSLDYSFIFVELGDNLIGCSGHHGGFINHKVRENFRRFVSRDPLNRVKSVFFITDLAIVFE